MRWKNGGGGVKVGRWYGSGGHGFARWYRAEVGWGKCNSGVGGIGGVEVVERHLC